MEFIVVLFILIGVLEAKSDDSTNRDDIQKYYDDLKFDIVSGECSSLRPPERIEKVNQMMARKFGIPDEARHFPKKCRALLLKNGRKNEIVVFKNIFEESHYCIDNCLLMESTERISNGMLYHDEKVYDLENYKTYHFNYTLNISDPNAEPAVRDNSLNYKITETSKKCSSTPTEIVKKVYEVEFNGSMDEKRYYDDFKGRIGSKRCKCSDLKSPERIEKANQITAQRFGIPEKARHLPEKCQGVMSYERKQNGIFVNKTFCRGNIYSHVNSHVICELRELMRSSEVIFNGLLHHYERVYYSENRITYHLNYTLNISDPNAEPTVQREPWNYEIPETTTKLLPATTEIVEEIKTHIHSGVNRIDMHSAFVFSNILIIIINVLLKNFGSL